MQSIEARHARSLSDSVVELPSGKELLRLNDASMNAIRDTIMRSLATVENSSDRVHVLNAVKLFSDSLAACLEHSDKEAVRHLERVLRSASSLLKEGKNLNHKL